MLDNNQDVFVFVQDPFIDCLYYFERDKLWRTWALLNPAGLDYNVSKENENERQNRICFHKRQQQNKNFCEMERLARIKLLGEESKNKSDASANFYVKFCLTKIVPALKKRC